MFKENDIREVALGVIVLNNKLLVEKGHDSIKKMDFYRCLGGGIEKNETPIEAVKREFMEELNIEISVSRNLGIIDNKFIYNGKLGHEIVHLFEISINKNDLKEKYTITDNGSISLGEWINIDDFKSGRKILFPTDMLNYI